MENGKLMKARWSTQEMATLVEVWAEVCDTPGASRMQRGGRLNKAISERYDARCKKSGLRLRSSNALLTQCDRMSRFTRFVRDFDTKELTRGRRSWFQLAPKEQMNKIPAEWRRQITTFTQEMYNMFKLFIMPGETGQENSSQKKRLLTSKRQNIPAARVKNQPFWTPQDEVQLARRWGSFLKRERLTLKAFVEIPYGKSCEFLAPKGRSPFSTWRKIRKLVESYSFISAFSAQHQPGWFELAENQRDVQLEWKELPHNFEDIEHKVFQALDNAARAQRDVVVKVKEEPEQTSDAVAAPSPKAISPVISANLEATTATLAHDDSLVTKAGAMLVSSNVLDQLLLEDDEVEVVGSKPPQTNTMNVPESLDADSTMNGACLLPDGKTPSRLEGPQVKEEVVTCQQQLNPDECSFQALETMFENQKSEVRQILCELQETLDSNISRSQEYLRAVPTTDSSASDGRSTIISQQHMELVVKNQTKRVISILHLAQETCSQNSAEIQCLTNCVIRSGQNPLLENVHAADISST